MRQLRKSFKELGNEPDNENLRAYVEARMRSATTFLQDNNVSEEEDTNGPQDTNGNNTDDDLNSFISELTLA